MNKVLATLVAGFLVTGAFAQAPATPAKSAATTGDAVMPAGEGTKGDMKKPMQKSKSMKHGKKHSDMAK